VIVSAHILWTYYFLSDPKLGAVRYKDLLPFLDYCTDYDATAAGAVDGVRRGMIKSVVSHAPEPSVFVGVEVHTVLQTENIWGQRFGAPWVPVFHRLGHHRLAAPVWDMVVEL